MVGNCNLGNVDCSTFPGIAITEEVFDCSGASLCGGFTVDAGGSLETCIGSSLTLGGEPSVSGGTGNYTYSWFPTDGLSAADVANPVAMITGNKTYTLSATDEWGCQQISTVIITGLSLPEVNYEIQETTSATSTDGSITLSISGGVAPYSVTWADGATTLIRGGLTAGIYDATVVDAKGCSLSISIAVTTAVTTNIEPQVSWIEAVTLYPNPVDKVLMMDLNSTKNSPILFQVVDQLGRILYEEKNTLSQGANHFDFDLPKLSDGEYFIQIHDEGKKPVFVKPFVKLGL